MMEKEAFSEFNLGSFAASEMSSTNLEDVRQEEKKLKRDSSIFTIVGLVTLLAAGLLMAPALLGEAALGAIIGLGVFGAVFAGVKIMRETNRKTLTFPKLKINRKSNKVPISRPFEETTYVRKTLTKSEKNRVFFGVAGGIAEFAGIPATVMRLIFILAFFFTGGAVVLPYFLLAIFMTVGRRMEKNRRLREGT